ncbi:MAG TPA: GNAT family N-acetyltransferase [Nitriliruptorales bacterium]|nr:GNAT family N-acetyltransferase [Nitriliruptorales bacterium]
MTRRRAGRRALRARWRRATHHDVDAVARRLAAWPCSPGGLARHQFVLATLDTRGPSVLRLAEADGGWAACLVLPGHLVIPAGDPELVWSAGVPSRRWRILVGDAEACEALLQRWGNDPTMIVHVQRFQTVDPARVPSPRAVPDPGLRPARAEDIHGLAELAVQLHLDDGYGPDPGAAGLRAYRHRMEASVEQGRVLTVGPLGRPLLKIERAVDSPRHGVQLSGICVRPERRGAGLGRASVAAAVRQALAVNPTAPVTLHVRADNQAALRAYAGAGFVDREEWRLAVRP